MLVRLLIAPVEGHHMRSFFQVILIEEIQLSRPVLYRKHYSFYGLTVNDHINLGNILVVPVW